MMELVLSLCFVSQDVLPDFTALGMHSSCVRMCVLVCLCQEQAFYMCFLTLEELIQLLTGMPAALRVLPHQIHCL